jgi:hypothetical protein
MRFFLIKIISDSIEANGFTPLIAQLVERRTVVGRLLSSGRWFDSGSAEYSFHMWDHLKRI